MVLLSGFDHDDVDTAPGKRIGVPVQLLGTQAEERMDRAFERSCMALHNM